MFSKVSSTSFWKKRKQESEKQSYIADLKRKVSDVQYVTKLIRAGHSAFVQRQGRTTF